MGAREGAKSRYALLAFVSIRVAAGWLEPQATLEAHCGCAREQRQQMAPTTRTTPSRSNLQEEQAHGPLPPSVAGDNAESWQTLVVQANDLAHVEPRINDRRSHPRDSDRQRNVPITTVESSRRRKARRSEQMDRSRTRASRNSRQHRAEGALEKMNVARDYAVHGYKPQTRAMSLCRRQRRA